MLEEPYGLIMADGQFIAFSKQRVSIAIVYHLGSNTVSTLAVFFPKLSGENPSSGCT